MEKTQIKLVQEPIIEHQLKQIGKKIREKIAALDLQNQIATIDSLKFLKETRAELNKEFKEYEESRKFIKNAVLNPYNEFEELYKSEITSEFKNADEILKTGIDSVEIKIKEERKEEIEIYFNELCQSEEIDFVKFEQTGIDIKLSDSMKSYKERCNAFVQKICSDIDLIKTQEFEPEIMSEFKQNLDASKSILTVTERKQREREEEKRLKEIETNSRISKLKNLGMQFDDMTNTYAFNDNIYISHETIESISKSEFNLKFVEFSEKIKSLEPVKDEPKETKKPVQQTVLSAPKVEEKQEKVNAKFQVWGTMSELKALGEYMKSKGLTYKNI